jgi:hypothetical protein
MQIVVANPRGFPAGGERASRIAGRARHGRGIARARQAAAVQARAARRVVEQLSKAPRAEALAAAFRRLAVVPGPGTPAFGGHE